MEYCPYRLRCVQPLNAVHAAPEIRGFLVRAEGGVACLQSWPALGEPAVEDVLRDFIGKRSLAMSRQAWRCCRLDGEARKAGVQLLDGRAVPESHFPLGPEGGSVPAGFTAVKVKAGKDFAQLRRTLTELRSALRVRLDFNETLDEGEFRRGWRELAAHHSRIDFVEDPVPYDEKVWRVLEEELGCRLAVDRCSGEAPFLRIWKPARNAWHGEREIVVTSNMDHPVGQSFAACRAADLADRLDLAGCGLVTHGLFEPADPFVCRMGSPTPDFPHVGGTGLGFDDLLEELPWEKL